MAMIQWKGGTAREIKKTGPGKKGKRRGLKRDSSRGVRERDNEGQNGKIKKRNEPLA